MPASLPFKGIYHLAHSIRLSFNTFVIVLTHPSSRMTAILPWNFMPPLSPTSLRLAFISSERAYRRQRWRLFFPFILIYLYHFRDMCHRERRHYLSRRVQPELGDAIAFSALVVTAYPAFPVEHHRHRLLPVAHRFLAPKCLWRLSSGNSSPHGLSPAVRGAPRYTSRRHSSFLSPRTISFNSVTK